MTAPVPKSIPPVPKSESKRVVAPKVTSGATRGIVHDLGEKIGIYSPGGMGKTSLVADVRKIGIDPLFIDLDQGSLGLDVARAVAGDDEHLVDSFEEVRATLQDKELISQFGMVVIDTFSTLEERVRDYVIRTIPHEKAKAIESIEDYGFGKGLIHIFEQSLKILGDLDAISRMGIHVVVICHQVTEKVPSADTVEDFLEYQPRLQSPPRAGKLRERLFEWTNHFFRIDHDRFVADGKVADSDARSIYTVRSTTAWAKHRALPNGREFPETIEFPKGSIELWEIMFGGDE
jgi:hypothetical protein